MLKSELMEILSNGENSGVEFKRDGCRPEQLAREIVALANFQGGRIFIGVEDDGSISGIWREGLEEWVMNVFQDKVHPMILPFYEEIQLEEGKRVAVISFPQGISKPYVVRHAGREDIYIRIGSTSRIATREQQARLYSLGGMLQTELMPVPGTSISCLDITRLENYLKDFLDEPEIPSEPSQWEQRLCGLGFLVESNEGYLCSIAGLVLFGVNPRRYLKQAGLRVMAFSGMQKDYKAQLDTILDGPMVGRWKVENSHKQLIDSGLIERLVDSAMPFICAESGKVDRYLRREKEWLYPLEALREVILNAFAHRDWTRAVDIEIGMYQDRFEVISPGALPNSMTLEKMKAGQRSPRNPVITEVLRDYGYVDSRGMGVRTKIIPLMKQQNNKEPIFKSTEDYLMTVLPKKDG
ncbi:transcriptional regulator [bacterium]|nr:transcriptional regulator [bacterium]